MYKIGFAIVAITALLLAARSFASHAVAPTNTSPAVPVLVELFTSEGCSSCPPADALLEKLDTQPFPGGQMIVLSEHVDYWNHIGWTDPYSSSAYSQRQSAYGRTFGLDSVYTPQMVVDGSDEFAGSDIGAARKAFDKAIRTEKIPVRISNATIEGHTLHAHVQAEASVSHPRHVDTFLVVALDHAESQVAKGENAGHRLTHVAVVRSLTKIGKLEPGKPLSEDVSVELDPVSAARNLRIIAFLQEHGQARILGATEVKVPR